MRHRGPSSSLQPAREAARAQSRALSPGIPRGTPPPPAPLIGDWRLAQDEHGALVAVHTPTGITRPLALPPEPTNEEGS